MQASNALTLPEPDADSALHSQRCREYIVDCIAAAGGSISFAEFMQHALYAPGLGYYAAGNTKFGPGGDFVTAPEVSPLFAAVVARQAAPVIAAIAGAEVFEFGAGSGVLAVQVLRKLAELEAVPARYSILEVSPELAERQQRYIEAHVPELADRVQWVADRPAGFRGVVLANEVLDALPVERFVRRRDGVGQCTVSLDGERFVWSERAAPPALLAEVERLEDALGSPLADGYCSEVSPAARHWVAELGVMLDEGLALLFDYGLPRHEYYAPERADGWLRCHFRHHAHNDPLILPGIQDLTTWVDFSAAADAARESGLEVAGFSAQAQFLLGGGLIDELGAIGEQPALSREVKLLTLPGEMGEHFKCLGLTAGDVLPPAGFAMGDRSHRL